MHAGMRHRFDSHRPRGAARGASPPPPVGAPRPRTLRCASLHPMPHLRHDGPPPAMSAPRSACAVCRFALVGLRSRRRFRQELLDRTSPLAPLCSPLLPSLLPPTACLPLVSPCRSQRHQGLQAPSCPRSACTHTSGRTLIWPHNEERGEGQRRRCLHTSRARRTLRCILARMLPQTSKCDVGAGPKLVGHFLGRGGICAARASRPEGQLVRAPAFAQICGDASFPAQMWAGAGAGLCPGARSTSTRQTALAVTVAPAR